MNRAESEYGRRGRRGGSRRADQAYTEDHADDYGHDESRGDDYDPEEDFSADYGHTHTRSADTDDGFEYDDGYEDVPEADGEQDDEEGGGRSSRRKGRGGRRSASPRRKSSGNRRGGVDRVSAFSASAIKKVSVLGDRPNQIVYTLAEQSKRKRGTAVLGVLMGAFSIALIALLGLLSYQLVTGTGGATVGGDESVVPPPEGHNTLTPELYLSEPNRDDVFGPISERPEGAEPMTEETVFGSVGEIELDNMQLDLRQSAVTDSCTSLVWGEELGQSLIDGNCVNAATGVYTDSSENHVAQVTVFDLADVDAATEAEKALDPTNAESDAGFLLTQTGEEVSGLEDGYSQANAQVMGHYLAVFWVANTDGSEPDDNAEMATLSVASMDAARFVYEEVVAVGGTGE